MNLLITPISDPECTIIKTRVLFLFLSKYPYPGHRKSSCIVGNDSGRLPCFCHCYVPLQPPWPMPTYQEYFTLVKAITVNMSVNRAARWLGGMLYDKAQQLQADVEGYDRWDIFVNLRPCILYCTNTHVLDNIISFTVHTSTTRW
jgi:hypothetical protein